MNTSQRLRYLLKVGKKEHIDQFASGNLYCNCAKTFWDIENNKVKGQGDALEAGTYVYAERVVFRPYDKSGNLTDDYFILNQPTTLKIRFGDAVNMPIFCMTAVLEDDCRIQKNNTLAICLSNKKKETLREHFPDADTVAIISDPQVFLNDVKISIGTRMESGFIKYYNLAEGSPLDNDRIANDLEYMNYVTQDISTWSSEEKRHAFLKAEYVYRTLFCKDYFFKDEQEYRIVLPDERIINGTLYPVRIHTPIEIIPFETFLNAERWPLLDDDE